MASAVATRRLRKELLQLQKDPPPGIIAEPQEHDILTWFFALRGPPQTPYHTGIYIGKLVFPTAYPMKAPRILMLTPSARFVVNERICMSMSDFHPELWNPSWSVATILTGVVSFMTSEEVTTGGIAASEEERQRLAQDSVEYNTKHFAHLFQGDILASFARADEARELAEKDRIATLVVKKVTKQKTATPAAAAAVAQSSSRQEQIKQNDDAVQSGQQQHNEPSTKEEEMSPEEVEKRRLRNAKKRAKQKAKKNQASADGGGNSQVEDDAKKEAESSSAV
jgi:ubiquitin-protein ligase